MPMAPDVHPPPNDARPSHPLATDCSTPPASLINERSTPRRGAPRRDDPFMDERPTFTSTTSATIGT